MKKHLLQIVVIALIVSMLGACAAPAAQPSAPAAPAAEPAAPAAEPAAPAAEPAAPAEPAEPAVPQVNSVSVYTCYVESEAMEIFDAFTAETGIEVNYVRLSTGEILTRLQAEKENPQVSVFMGGAVDSHTNALNNGLLDPYVSKNINLVDPSLVDPKGVYTPVSMIVTAFASNTEWLAANGLEAPTSWADLLSDKYVGNVCMAHPGTSGAAYTCFSTILQGMGVDAGFEYLKKLDKNIVQYTKAGAAPYRMAGLGETGIGIGYDLDANKTIEEGYPLVVTYPSDGAGCEVTCCSMVKGGPANEVEAAHRFIDWMLEETSQTMATNQFYRFPTNPSIPLSENRVPMSEINLIDYDSVWSAENKTAMVERFENDIRSSENVIK